MPIPPIQKQLTEKLMQNYCEKKVPIEAQNEIKLSYTIRGNNITLIESRPYWRDETKWTTMKIAQIRFENEGKTFTLYCPDRNERWHEYNFIEPSIELENLLKEIDNDPTGIFWG